MIALLFLISACVNNTTSANKPGENSSVPQTKSEPDAIDLLDALQGKWQSEQDSTYLIDIVGNKMKHFNGGALTMETEIEVDANCLNEACKQEGSDLADGWCFIEKSQSGTQCNRILKCDKYRLQFHAVGAAAAVLAFQKVP